MRQGKTLFLNMHVLRSILEGATCKNSTKTAAIKTDYSFDVLRLPISLKTCFLSTATAPA